MDGLQNWFYVALVTADESSPHCQSAAAAQPQLRPETLRNSDLLDNSLQHIGGFTAIDVLEADEQFGPGVQRFIRWVE
jgi:hypothetical protein